MKLIDFTILFGCILMGLFFINDGKIKMLNETQISGILLNKNMDEIVVDGLTAGFVDVDASGKKEVDLDRVKERVFAEMSLLFYGKKDMSNLVYKYVSLMMYVDEDGYCLYEDGTWKEKIYFDDESTHSDRIEIVSKIIEERTCNTALISYNDGESYKNTIDDNTLIIVYCGYNFKTSKLDYKNNFISAASIKAVR